MRRNFSPSTLQFLIDRNSGGAGRDDEMNRPVGTARNSSSFWAFLKEDILTMNQKQEGSSKVDDKFTKIIHHHVQTIY